MEESSGRRDAVPRRRHQPRPLARSPTDLARGGDNSLVRVSAVRSLALVRAVRLQLFKMSPMAVTGSIFNRAEISAGGTAGKEPE